MSMSSPLHVFWCGHVSFGSPSHVCPLKLCIYKSCHTPSSPSFLISQITYNFCPEARLVSCYVSSPLPLSLQNKNRFLSMSFLVLRPPPHFKITDIANDVSPPPPPLTKIFICDLLCPVALFENHAYNVPKLIKDSFHVCWTPGLEFRKSARLAVDGEFCVGGLDLKKKALWHADMSISLAPTPKSTSGQT
jgi:hypothetical protein